MKLTKKRQISSDKQKCSPARPLATVPSLLSRSGCRLADTQHFRPPRITPYMDILYTHFASRLTQLINLLVWHPLKITYVYIHKCKNLVINVK